MYKYFVTFLLLFSSSAFSVEYLVVTNDSVRVREQPGLKGRSMLMLNKGHLVIKMEEKGDWTRIYFAGKEKRTGKTEGWMHSSFLKEERKVVEQSVPEELRLEMVASDLACEKIMGAEIVQGCDLHLQYKLHEAAQLSSIKVNCSAELVAKTRSGELIPVPVNQTLKHSVVQTIDDFSMHIIMKADASYQLEQVSLEGSRCRLVGYSN
ncbi:SH3 domain-containing protein [Neptuniibacter sp. SY11_33]|uniref:SH3 domain-containing protein n=1 Tax=Neptuniibacter sp. SY11_33 TaxID=3398215 RepID=UPI0039F6257C